MVDFLIYKVRQFNEAGDEISLLETSSPVVAISDFTIKTKILYKNDLSRSINVQQLLGTDDNSIIRLVAIVEDNERDVRESVIYLETCKDVTDTENNESFSPETIGRYKSEPYIKALSEVTDSLIKLSGGNLEIMKIIAVLASKDPSHELWRTSKHSEKKLCLNA